jgi:peptidoglycan/LPS O-acetylase OafA/YrhL
MRSQRIYLFDIARSLAAYLVLIFHIRALLSVPFAQVENPDTFQWIYYFFTGFGHQAVIIFFAISGYLIGGMAMSSQDFNFKVFMHNRINRLWIVLIPALFLTLGLDQFIDLSILNGSLKNELVITPSPGAYSVNIENFFINMFFLQEILPPTYGTNSPLWSLAFEWWFYVLIALSVYCYQRYSLKIALLIITIAHTLIFFVMPSIVMGYVVFIVAALISYKDIWVNSSWRRYFFTLIGFVSFLTGMYLARSTAGYYYFYYDWMIGIGFALFTPFVNSVMINNKSLSIRIINFLPKSITNSSYSLYVVHMSIILLIFSLIDVDRNQFDTLKLMQFLAMFITSIFVASVFWMLFERHTTKLKNVSIGLVQKISASLHRKKT